MTTNILFQMAARIPQGIERKEGKSVEAMVAEIKSEIIGKIGEGDTRFKQLQVQVDGIDAKLADRHVAQGCKAKSLRSILSENESFSRLLHDKKGSARIALDGDEAAALLERKSTITSAGYAPTSGVLTIDRTPEITLEPRQVLRMRNVLTARPTTAQYVDFIKVLSPMSKASPAAEGTLKMENAVTFLPVMQKVCTLATWIPASKQILDDLGELAAFLESTLRYYVDLEEEAQILSGDNTAENYHGLISQATAFDTSLLSAGQGWNEIDIIGRAIEQLGIAKEITPTFVTLNPRNWANMRLLKDAFGRYILGSPQANVAPALFNLNVVETTSIAAGTFLVGSGDPIACELRDRMQLLYEVSTEDSDKFRRNLVSCRAEKRACLITKRPGSYVTGSFSTSPA
jgi:HK97 family phage major capsid protein